MKRQLDPFLQDVDPEGAESKPGTRLQASPRRPKPRVSAKAKVIQYLSRREHATEELRQKLTATGYEAADIQSALDWAASHSFQSNDRFALSLHRRRASTYGDRAIEAELGQLGLKGTLKNLDADPQFNELLAESERAFDWMQRRYAAQLAAIYQAEEGLDSGELFKLKAKVWQALTRRGFEIRNIDTAWRRLTVELNSEQ